MLASTKRSAVPCVQPVLNKRAKNKPILPDLFRMFHCLCVFALFLPIYAQLGANYVTKGVCIEIPAAKALNTGRCGNYS